MTDFAKEPFVCTAENPWSEEKAGDRRVQHKDAREVSSKDGWPGGDIATYECPNCKYRFSVEVAQ